MIDEFAKEYLHSDLREVREAMLWKLEGLSEYDARRPLTATGTSLLGLIKHLSITEARRGHEHHDGPMGSSAGSRSSAIGRRPANKWGRCGE